MRPLSGSLAMSQNICSVCLYPSSRPNLSRLVRWVTPRLPRPVVDDDHVTREGALPADHHHVGDGGRLVPRGNDDVDIHVVLRDNPARSPRATTFTATLREASSIISSPNITAPRRSSSVALR